MTAPTAFDLGGELPRRTTVLEASAGTGKTYTIAALVARYLAEGHAELGELMIVTFGRMATDELRVRVRERLVSLEHGLTRVLEGPGPPAEADQVNRLLTTGEVGELVRRRARIRRALSDFDAATIATTHEFCQRMLDGLGVLGNREPDAVFSEWLGDLTAEAARDVYLRRYAAAGDAPFSFEEASRLASTVVDSPHTRLVPSPPAAGANGNHETEEPGWARQVDFALEVRAEVQRRKQRARLFSYDDMLTRLRDALADRHTGEAAARRLRQRYRIVLVDEFQDTDVIQWEILRRAFHGHSDLILIGDPKQAIYAFRGADVYSYLDAVDRADQVATLEQNWRSDRALTEALEQLAGGASLGHKAIIVRPVHSYHLQRRIGSAATPAIPAVGDVPTLHDPFRLRVVPPRPADQPPARVAELRQAIERDLVADVTALLAAPPKVRVPLRAGKRSPHRQVQGLTAGGAHAAPGGQARGERSLCPSDIAVLVRTNARGESIRDALIEAGVPAVMLGSTSVFCSPVAAEWLTLLSALEQPRQLSARSAALTCFLGWTFAELADADERALTGLAQQIRDWSRVLAARGVAALLEVAAAETRLTETLLGQLNGERTLTDLRHIGQALHAAMTTNRLGITALVEWLRDQIAQARVEARTDSTRRLETDAEAVQILTLHRSKGLEFPIVYLPEAWDSFTADVDDGRVLRLHEQNANVLDVGGVYGPGRAERLLAQQREDAGEDLRLLYVGLTRAQCSVVTWWADSARNTTGSPLHRLLFRGAREGELASSYPVPAEPLEALRRCPGATVEVVEDRAPRPMGNLLRSPTDLTVRTFHRSLDLEWRRTSYSALTAAAHGLASLTSSLGQSVGSLVGSEVDVAWEEDEAQQPPAAPAAAVDAASAPGLEQSSPMQDLPGGVLFGTVVHAVLEEVDPQAEDLAARLRQICATALARTQLGEIDPGTLAGALLRALHTPLGGLAGDRRLVDIGLRDRLTELNFELPLAGGETTTAEVRLGDLVPLLHRHLAPDDALAGYPELLAHPELAEQSLRGYLTGSIDAVLRVRDASGEPRYLVVDYKTNWLGTVDGPELRLADYTPDRMARAMMAAHYPLQALLYAVAVHRMLRWRQPDYRPDHQLGGVLYLFVRGMAGADTPRIEGVPCGVFSWRPAPELVVECSDLLERGPQ